MAYLAIIVSSSYNSHFQQSKRAKNEFSVDLSQKLPSHISPGSPVYSKPLGQQKKHKDSFPQTPGFFADCIFILVM